MSENDKHVDRARQMVAAGAIEVRYGREYDAQTVRGLLARIDELADRLRVTENLLAHVRAELNLLRDERDELVCALADARCEVAP